MTAEHLEAAVRAAITSTAAVFEARLLELQRAAAVHLEEATRLRLELAHAQDLRAKERREHDRRADLDLLERDVRDALLMPRSRDLRERLAEAMAGRDEE